MPHHPSDSRSTARLLWALYSLFIVYGTTLPFRFVPPHEGLPGLLRGIDPDPLGLRGGHFKTDDLIQILLPDMIQNILLFVPFGFLAYLSLADKQSRLKRVRLVLLGTGLSAFVEFLQLFTATRFSAFSDVVYNTLGTALGLAAGTLLKGWVMSLAHRPALRRVLESPSAFPALAFCGLAVAGSWEPFDFTLTLGGALAKARIILANPFDLSWPNDELITFIRFLLATLFACRLAAESGLPRPRRAVVPALAGAAVLLEAAQIFVGSRSPAFQDMATSVLGVLGGAIAFRFPAFHRHPWAWGILGTLAVASSAALADLYPFAFGPSHVGFNWIPFSYGEALTAFTAMSHFLEAGLTWFPLAFLLGYFFPGRRTALVSLALSVSIALGLETAQGFVAGRYSDITDVLGAAVGSLAGSLFLSRGWRAYREYTGS